MRTLCELPKSLGTVDKDLHIDDCEPILVRTNDRFTAAHANYDNNPTAENEAALVEMRDKLSKQKDMFETRMVCSIT